MQTSQDQKIFIIKDEYQKQGKYFEIYDLNLNFCDTLQTTHEYTNVCLQTRNVRRIYIICITPNGWLLITLQKQTQNYAIYIGCANKKFVKLQKEQKKSLSQLCELLSDPLKETYAIASITRKADKRCSTNNLAGVLGVSTEMTNAKSNLKKIHSKESCDLALYKSIEMVILIAKQLGYKIIFLSDAASSGCGDVYKYHQTGVENTEKNEKKMLLEEIYLLPLRMLFGPKQNSLYENCGFKLYDQSKQCDIWNNLQHVGDESEILKQKQIQILNTALNNLEKNYDVKKFKDVVSLYNGGKLKKDQDEEICNYISQILKFLYQELDQHHLTSYYRII